MILDGQNTFSNLASGDSPTAIADNASGNVIDQALPGSLFTQGGGAYVGMWLEIVVNVAGVSAGGGTIQAVLQDSPDNVTWTDRQLGAVTTAANAVVGAKLIKVRLKESLARYVRVIYRIATAVFTAGTYIAYLTPDVDVFDLSQRQATGTVSEPSGASDEAVANGVLGS